MPSPAPGGDDGQQDDEAARLPSLRPPPLEPAASTTSAWSGAFDDASLASPSGLMSARSFTFVRPSMRPTRGELERQQQTAAAAVTTAWQRATVEARTLGKLALPVAITNLAGFLIGVVTLGLTGRLGAFELRRVSAAARGKSQPACGIHLPAAASFTWLLTPHCCSSAVLATTLFNVSGASVLMGFAAAMETLCGCVVPAAASVAACCSSLRLSLAVLLLSPSCWPHPPTAVPVPAPNRQAYGAGNYRMVGVVFQRAIVLTTLVAAAVAALWSQAETLLLLFR